MNMTWMLPQFTWPWALFTQHPRDCLTFDLGWRKIQICFKLIVGPQQTAVRLRASHLGARLVNTTKSAGSLKQQTAWAGPQAGVRVPPQNSLAFFTLIGTWDTAHLHRLSNIPPRTVNTRFPTNDFMGEITDGVSITHLGRIFLKLPTQHPNDSEDSSALLSVWAFLSTPCVTFVLNFLLSTVISLNHCDNTLKVYVPKLPQNLYCVWEEQLVFEDFQG